MPVVCVTEFEVERSRGVAHYDAVVERVGLEADPPPGLIVHCVGFTPDGVFRVIDVWETEAHARRFGEQRLEPVLAALEAELAAPARQRSHAYELHHVVRGHD